MAATKIVGSSTGIALLAALSIPETDVIRLDQGVVAVRRIWEAQIESWLVENAQEVYLNWWRDAQLLTEVGINDRHRGYVINGSRLSTSETFAEEFTETYIIDGAHDAYHQGYFSSGSVLAEVYHNRLPYDQPGFYPDFLSMEAETYISSSGNEFGRIRAGHWVEHRFSLGAFEEGKFGFSRPVPESIHVRTANGPVSTSVVKPALPTVHDGWRVIVGPAACSRAEFHPSYWWVVASTLQIAHRMKNLRKYVTDRNERTRVDQQIAMIEARGLDLMGVGMFGDGVRPFRLYKPTRRYADMCEDARSTYDGVDWAIVNERLGRLRGQTFCFQTNVADKADQTAGLVAGAGAVTLTLDGSVVTSSTGDIHPADVWPALITALRSEGREVRVVGEDLSSETGKALSAAAAGNVASYGELVREDMSDEGFFGLGMIQNAMKPPSASEQEFARLLLDPSGATLLELFT